MCGIAGLFLKDQRLAPELGGLLSGMLEALSDRGPDSAGFAVYGDGDNGQIKLTLRAAPSFDFAELMASLGKIAGAPIPYQVHDTHAVISVPTDREAVAMLSEYSVTTYEMSSFPMVHPSSTCSFSHVSFLVFSFL